MNSRSRCTNGHCDRQTRRRRQRLSGSERCRASCFVLQVARTVWSNKGFRSTRRGFVHKGHKPWFNPRHPRPALKEKSTARRSPGHQPGRPANSPALHRSPNLLVASARQSTRSGYSQCFGNWVFDFDKTIDAQQAAGTTREEIERLAPGRRDHLDRRLAALATRHDDGLIGFERSREYMGRRKRWTLLIPAAKKPVATARTITRKSRFASCLARAAGGSGSRARHSAFSTPGSVPDFSKRSDQIWQAVVALIDGSGRRLAKLGIWANTFRTEVVRVDVSDNASDEDLADLLAEASKMAAESFFADLDDGHVRLPPRTWKGPLSFF